MKKRLRKKKHIGEFAEWGRQILIVRNRKDGLDEFLDARRVVTFRCSEGLKKRMNAPNG